MTLRQATSKGGTSRWKGTTKAQRKAAMSRVAKLGWKTRKQKP